MKDVLFFTSPHGGSDTGINEVYSPAKHWRLRHTTSLSAGILNERSLTSTLIVSVSPVYRTFDLDPIHVTSEVDELLLEDSHCPSEPLTTHLMVCTVNLLDPYLL